MAIEKPFIPTPFEGTDPVSKALKEFYLSLDPADTAPYINFKIHLIRPDSIPPVSFYIKRKKNHRLFRDAQEKISGFEIKALLDAGFDTVYVTRAEAPVLRKYLEAFLQADLTAPSGPDQPQIPVESRIALMRSAAISNTQELFANPSPENIRKSMKVVSGFINLLVRDPKAFYYLIRLSSHDAYTYQHSVGVGLHAISIAKKIRINNEQELMDLGIAGLLHDIGKTRVKPEIINKPGPLTPEEWEEMHQHSQWGYDIVKNNDDLTERAKLAMWQHHEEPNGGGYPQKLKLHEIVPFAKIITLADIFNALTTDRTYSKAMPPFEALKLIKTKMIHKVDPQLFVELVMIYGGKLE